MGMSTYLKNALINHVLRQEAFAVPTIGYVALYTSDPTDSDTGIEVSGGSYSRKSCACSAPVNGVTSNTTGINLAVATADWGTITHIGIRSAATGGNLWFYGPLSVPEVINTTNQLQFLAGQLTIALS